MVEYELWFVTKFPCGCVIAEYIGTAFVVEEFPQDLIGYLSGRGDLPSDEVEPEVENGDQEGDLEWPEALEDYLQGALVKYWLD